MVPFRYMKRTNSNPRPASNRLPSTLVRRAACLVSALLFCLLIFASYSGRLKNNFVRSFASTAGSVGSKAHLIRADLIRHEADNIRTCHVETHADYFSQMIVAWGPHNKKDSAEACCAACVENKNCGLWVWCGDPDSCNVGAVNTYQECWLKHLVHVDYEKPLGNRGPDVKWTSGLVYSQAQLAASVLEYETRAVTEKKRLAVLRDDTSKVLVFLDVSIKGVPVGRMEFVLFTKESPRAAENFRALCTGEKGVAPAGHEGAGKPYHFKGNYFYRIIDQFIDQTGAGTDSVFGGMFKDDPGGLALKHDKKGLLSMANAGPDTNTSHFSILCAAAHHLDGLYTIFGELVSGWEVAAKINALSKGKPDNTANQLEGARITDSGQLR